MAEPWGEHITIHVYVEGRVKSGRDIVDASNAAADLLQERGCIIDFAGASHSPVIDKPDDQGAT